MLVYRTVQAMSCFPHIGFNITAKQFIGLGYLPGVVGVVDAQIIPARDRKYDGTSKFYAAHSAGTLTYSQSHKTTPAYATREQLTNLQA